MSENVVPNFDVRLSYPRDDEFDIYTKLERINLDKECEKEKRNEY